MFPQPSESSPSKLVIHWASKSRSVSVTGAIASRPAPGAAAVVTPYGVRKLPPLGAESMPPLTIPGPKADTAFPLSAFESFAVLAVVAVFALGTVPREEFDRAQGREDLLRAGKLECQQDPHAERDCEEALHAVSGRECERNESQEQRHVCDHIAAEAPSRRRFH